MNLSKKISLFFVTLLILSGCAAKTNIDPRVNVIDTLLDENITITDVSTSINNGELIELQVTGKNETSFYKKLEYKVEWLDQRGVVISTIMSRWTSFSAYENTKFRFKAVAPKKSASDFRVIIRRGEG